MCFFWRAYLEAILNGYLPDCPALRRERWAPLRGESAPRGQGGVQNCWGGKRRGRGNLQKTPVAPPAPNRHLQIRYLQRLILFHFSRHRNDNKDCNSTWRNVIQYQAISIVTVASPCNEDLINTSHNTSCQPYMHCYTQHKMQEAFWTWPSCPH